MDSRNTAVRASVRRSRIGHACVAGMNGKASITDAEGNGQAIEVTSIALDLHFNLVVPTPARRIRRVEGISEVEAPCEHHTRRGSGNHHTEAWSGRVDLRRRCSPQSGVWPRRDDFPQSVWCRREWERTRVSTVTEERERTDCSTRIDLCCLEHESRNGVAEPPGDEIERGGHDQRLVRSRRRSYGNTRIPGLADSVQALFPRRAWRTPSSTHPAADVSTRDGATRASATRAPAGVATSSTCITAACVSSTHPAINTCVLDWCAHARDAGRSVVAWRELAPAPKANRRFAAAEDNNQRHPHNCSSDH